MIHYPGWKLALYGLILVLGIVFAIPNLFSRDTVRAWPAYLPKTHGVMGMLGLAQWVVDIDKVDGVALATLVEMLYTERATVRTQIDQAIAARPAMENFLRQEMYQGVDESQTRTDVRVLMEQ